MKKYLLGLALALFVTGAAFAGNDNHGNSNSGSGYAGVAGGYSVTTGTSAGYGTSSSDASGGSQATTSVYGTGHTTQFTQNGESTYASSGVQVGLGYANTATSGGSTSYGHSSGSQYGNASGNTDGKVGGDFSATANGAYNVTNYAGQGDAYIVVGYGSSNHY
jgi:hypothetical protein